MAVPCELVEGTTTMATAGRLGYERARARQSEGESENGREQQLCLPLLPLLARPARLTLASGRHVMRVAWERSAMMRSAGRLKSAVRPTDSATLHLYIS